MKRTILFVLMLFIGLQLFAQSGLEIMQKVDAAAKPSTSRSLVVMELIEKNGDTSSRQVEYIIANKNDIAYSLVLFHSPANVKDTRFLSIEYPNKADDRWIYLPALKKVRRIAASEGGSSFMGTDFTYDDMAERDINKYEYQKLREEKTNDFDCWVVEVVPKSGTDSQYSRSIFWVDKESLLTVRVELFDKDGELLKTSVCEQIAQVQGHWSIIKNRMTNNRTGHATLLEIKKLVYDSEIDERVFSTTFLETGRY